MLLFIGNQNPDVVFTITNQCTQDLWIGADGRSESRPTFVFNGLNFHTPNNGGWKLAAGSGQEQVARGLEITFAVKLETVAHGLSALVVGFLGEGSPLSLLQSSHLMDMATKTTLIFPW